MHENDDLREASDQVFDDSVSKKRRSSGRKFTDGLQFFDGGNNDLHENDDLYEASPPRQNIDQYSVEKPDEEEVMSEHPPHPTARQRNLPAQLRHEGSRPKGLQPTVASSCATTLHALRPEIFISDIDTQSPVLTSSSNTLMLGMSQGRTQKEDTSSILPSLVSVNADFASLTTSLSTPLEAEMTKQAKELSKSLLPRIEEDISVTRLNVKTSEAALLQIKQDKQNIKEEDEKSQRQEEKEEARSHRILAKIRKNREMRLERDEKLRVKEARESEILKVSKQNLAKKEAALLAHQSLVKAYDSD